MKKHEVGDSIIINSIKPVPSGWHNRETIKVGNRYQDPELWNTYKDYNPQLFVDTLTGTDPKTDIAEIIDLRIDAFKVMELDSSNVPEESSLPVWVFKHWWITTQGTLCFLSYCYKSGSDPKVYYKISTSVDVLIDETTDYQYLYDTMGETLTHNDFNHTIITKALRYYNTSRGNDFLEYIDMAGHLCFGMDEMMIYDTWYADDRNGTNYALLNQVLYYRLNLDNLELSFQKAGQFIAPRSLNKIPSSNPQNAMYNYAFDINNTETVRMDLRLEKRNFDCHSMVPVMYCDATVKEYYEVGFPPVHSFNYYSMNYYMPFSGSPVICEHVNGGSVTRIEGIYGGAIDTYSAVFNNRIIRSTSKLSGIYSGISGIEIVQPNTDFKVTDQLSKVHTAYDFNGKYMPPLQYHYFRYGTDDIDNKFSDSNAREHINYFRTDAAVNAGIAMAPIHKEWSSASNYLPVQPFYLSNSGFGFVGDSSWISEVKSYQTLNENSSYGFMPSGYQYIVGGDLILELQRKFLQKGNTYLTSGKQYTQPPYMVGTDAEGYHIIMDNCSPAFGYNKNQFLYLQQTSSVGDTVYSSYGRGLYRVSDDMEEIIAIYHHSGSGGSRSNSAGANRFMTKDWTNIRGGIVYGIGNSLYNPIKQKDTYTMPSINTENGSDYRYITKIRT